MIHQKIRWTDRWPRFQLGHLPTPLEPLDRLSAECGGPRIWVKRDDCTGLATGGNKTRKLEYLVGAALREGADFLVSGGALQSNHARQVAAAAARAGLSSWLMLMDAVPDQHEIYARAGNVLLDRVLGARLKFTGPQLESGPVLAQMAQQLRDEGHRPYVIPVGGSNGLGSLGYADAFLEIEAQMDAAGEPFDVLVHATGSGGTQAGLLLGALKRKWQGRLIGISVGAPAAVGCQRVMTAALEGAQLLELERSAVESARIEVDAGYTGPGYGRPDRATVEAIELAARLEGLLLDPVYSGKGMAGLIGACRRKAFAPDVRNVVFLHTGGTAALSAYPDLDLTN